MSRPVVREFWVTVRLDPCRTIDRRVSAPTPWAAGWLWRQLHPCDDVVHVREVKR